MRPIKILSSGRTRSRARTRENMIREARGGLIKVEPLIHRIKMSLEECNFNIIKNELNLLDPHQANSDELRGLPYLNCVYKKSRLGTIKILLNPNEPFYPRYYLETSDSSPEHLKCISEAIPELKISMAEYAIDLFCKDPRSVSDMFFILRRYIYFPSKTETSMDGGPFKGWGEGRDENSVYSIWSKNDEKEIIIYERGPDDKKRKGKPGWNHEHVDRVRIEVRVRRKAKTLKNNKIDWLNDFVTYPKLGKIMSQKLKFRIFRDHHGLPQEDDDYITEKNKDNFEGFQEEFLEAKNSGTIKNISQSIQVAENMRWLINKLRDACSNFRKNWKKRVREANCTPFI